MQQGVITGDIVNSTIIEVGKRQLLLSKFEEFLNGLEPEFETKGEIFRGDSFQCLVKKPVQCLKLALLQKTFIRSFNKGKVLDARIAIGIGEIDLISSRLGTSSGQAFELSGQLLDNMKSKKHYLAIATNDTFNDELQAECILLDAIISKTTALQCEVIQHKLRGLTEVQIAKKLSIDQSAVNHRSNSGNWNAIDAMLKRFEKIYSNE